MPICSPSLPLPSYDKVHWIDDSGCTCVISSSQPGGGNVSSAEQEEMLELLSTLQQLPLKVRTEEQEAILQGLSPAEMGAHLDHFQLLVLEPPSTMQTLRAIVVTTYM